MKCFIHKWVYDKPTYYKCNRTCSKCNKKQHSMYDMTYGGTYWVDGIYWDNKKEMNKWDIT